MKSLRLVIAGLFALALVGCSSSDMKPEDSIESTLKNSGVKAGPGESGKHAGSTKAEKPADAQSSSPEASNK